MTRKTIDQGWVAAYEAEAARLAREGMYLPEEEHASCGVGLVAAIDGVPRREVVEHGIAALKAVWHRGAVDADGKTGDGAGIHVQIPVPFFWDQIRRTGHEPQDALCAVGQVFLPRTNFAAQETCRTIVETEVLRLGYYIYGWRQVPVNIAVLGEKANATRPGIEQILLSNVKGVDEETFERELYVIRRRIEKAVAQAQITGFYICSLSCRSVIYKGMMLAEQVAEFYPDLKDERFASAFAIYHQRYSTNTFPQWWLAQPFRMLAHNGEINTLKGNMNWMRSHEIRMASSFLGELAEDIKPIIPNGASDSAALDAVFEVMVRGGRNAPMAKTMLVPEAWSSGQSMPEAWRAMYSYSNAVMEPWDGPAALAMTDGRWVCAGLDRNGLRPMRYVVTGDGLVIAGSEAGMVPTDEATIREKGRLGPGQMLAIDQGRAGRRPALCRLDREGHRDLGRDRGPPGTAPSERRRPAAAPDRGGLFHRGAGDHPAPDGRGRQGGDRLDGRRHALGGAVGPVPALVPFLPAEFQPGDQPADRFPARAPGDEPEDPVRQPEERAGPGFEPDRDHHAREPGGLERPVPAADRRLRRRLPGDPLRVSGGQRGRVVAARAEPGPGRGRGGGARGRRPRHPDRRAGGRRQHRHADDPGDLGGA
jgi:glutamate synthase domain-containing protein 1